MIDDENYKKISIECSKCKTKFEIWVSIANFTDELERNIRENFYLHCPVCRILEGLKNKEN